MKNRLKKKTNFLPRCKQTRIKRPFLNKTVKLDDVLKFSVQLFTTDQFFRSSWEVVLGRLAKPLSDFASVAV